MSIGGIISDPNLLVGSNLAIARAGVFGARIQRGGGGSTLTVQQVGPDVEINGTQIPAGNISGLILTNTDHLLNNDGSDSGAAPVANTLAYVYMSAGTLVWSASAPARNSSGIYYLGAAGTGPNYRFVGMVWVNGTSTFDDDTTNRGVFNYYNRLLADILLRPGYTDDNANTTYALNSATFVALNAGTGATASYVTFGDMQTEFDSNFVCTPGGVNDVFLGIGFDSTTDCIANATIKAGAVTTSVGVSYYTQSSGRHTVTLVGASNGAATIIGDFARHGAVHDPVGTYLIGRVWN